jgi:molybdopterin-guanine dinucleotide biosynthesis protein A
MIDRVDTALRHVTDVVVIASNDADAYTWVGMHEGIPLKDRHPGMGGLAGVEAALAYHPHVVVVAWDMPFVSAQLLEAILGVAHKYDADAVVPESTSPHGIEPFCAVYSEAVREQLSQFFERGGGAAHEFIAGLPRLYRLPLADVKRIGDPDRLFFSVNTPQDLARARAMANATE